MAQYIFDPTTQTYRAAPQSGLGALYDAGDGNATNSPGASMSDPGMAEMGVAMQNIGQFTATNPVAAAFSPVTSMVTTGIGAIGNAMMNSEVSPVANPVAPQESAIAPATVGLAAMNAQTAAQQNAQAQQAQVANTATAVAQGVAQGSAPGQGVAVSEAADAAQDVANAQDAAAAAGVADAGGAVSNVGGDGNGGPSGDAAVSGAANEASHSADGNDSGPGSAGDPDGNGTGPGGGWNRGGQIMKYESGGIAAAKKAESLGRGEDKVLVHMTPNEVRGLQAIAMAHGGSLTINPETGLVEANFLKSILPMVAGAALTIGSGGTLSPLVAAMLVGGGYGVATGSLQKGLMAGLGAYGGAGLGAGLMSAGAAAPAATGTAEGLAAQGAAGAQAASSATPSAFQMAQSNIDPALLESMSATQVAGTMPAASQAQLMGQGAQNLLTQGGREAFSAGVKEATGLGVLPTVGAAAAPAMFSAEEPAAATPPGQTRQAYIRPYSFDYQRASDIDPNFKYRTGAKGESTAEQRYFTPTFTPMGVFKAGTEPGGSFYGTPTDDLYKLYSGPKYAEGGIARGGLKDGAFVVPADVVSHLGNGSNDAGQKILARGLGAHPIKGKGDGMSDSIPTTIEGKQPARVADGEAYIPPEVVKKVGAKRLYSMMDKIRHARTGTKKQAPEVDPRKFLPA